MVLDLLIVIGFSLIAIGIIFALPFFGVGLILPFLGDFIDIPISAILVVAGIFLLIIGGLGLVITQYWWLIILGFAIWYLLFVLKIGVKTRR